MFIFRLPSCTVFFTKDLSLILSNRKNMNITKQMTTLLTTDAKSKLAADLEIPGSGWMVVQCLTSNRFHTFEIIETTWKPHLKTPATREGLWIICIWGYWAGESGIFYIMVSRAKFEPPQHSLISMTLFNSSYYLKNRSEDELFTLVLDLNAKFSKISGLNWIRIR